ncbi:hypothetical protein FPE01S_01_13350 [Flavihumibacter petaseus NBRC 106054]|uniref:Uncharacterized protein n=2 Tax=Flavihumibacter TaxID=1004301 RepID=A0A0E9MXZ9_9BACT|nr:hypothetical protein FPE01S_01_13350 [Flavihumibacter petaseus NBRC 106054]
MIYYKRGTGTFIVTEPKPWAHENQKHFPEYSFNDGDVPTVDEIETYLIKNYNFKLEADKINKISVLFNLNPSLNL